jgi:hypothetical protein
MNKSKRSEHDFPLQIRGVPEGYPLKIEKALIIRKEWLDRIFDDGKIWEMRSRVNRYQGWIALIEAGSGLIVGQAFIHASLSPCDEKTLHAGKSFHQVDDFSLLKKWCYPWQLSMAERYHKPIPYKHPKGAVIWVDVKDQYGF